MSSTGFRLPLLRDLIPGPLDYGTMLMVEFQPGALWYESSLSIAAQAIREGTKTTYHVFEHPPDDIKRFLARLGLDARKLREDGVFSIVDSFTSQTGLSLEQKENFPTGRSDQSLRVSDWSIESGQRLKAGIPQERKGWLHIDENLGVILQYNQERAVIDWARTRLIPTARATDGVSIHSFLKGVASESFYNQFESLSDGLIEFKSEEKGLEIQSFVRVRSLKGKKHDTRWHGLQMRENGEISLTD